MSLPQVIDLTHPITPAMPHWPGDPPTCLEPAADIPAQGYFLHSLAIGEHSGTHIGVARHLDPAGISVDLLSAEALVRPAVVLDFRAEAGADADAELEPAHIVAWEGLHGRIPSKAVLLLCTGWSSRWGDPAAYFNMDEAGTMHFPGYSPAAVDFLVQVREVMGLGIDTAGIDAGRRADLAANAALLDGPHYHLENLTNLEHLPPTGAWLVIGALPIAGGSGAPARLLALLPRAPHE